MTSATLTNRTARVTNSNVTRFSIFRSIWRTVVYRMHQYQSVRHLNSLSSETLRDIGIHRSEIRSVVYGRAGERVRVHDV